MTRRMASRCAPGRKGAGRQERRRDILHCRYPIGGAAHVFLASRWQRFCRALASPRAKALRLLPSASLGAIVAQGVGDRMVASITGLPAMFGASAALSALVFRGQRRLPVGNRSSSRHNLKPWPATRVAVGLLTASLPMPLLTMAPEVATTARGGRARIAGPGGPVEGMATENRKEFDCDQTFWPIGLASTAIPKSLQMAR
jgi:hypothetical protein